MPSTPRTSASGTCFISLLPALLLLSSADVHGASLRAHRLRGSDSDDAQRGNVYAFPNADMLKALEYIESLHQRAGLDSQQPPLATGARDGRVGESGKPRSPLRLTSAPVRADEEAPEEKSEELLQAVLSTLQQTEKASQPGGLHRTPDRSGAKDKHSLKPHRQLPLMFEDEEEGEGDEEEEDGPEPNTPLKRTNENVEEKYTPQNLATLQSIFDELDKLTLHKRQNEEEEEEEKEEEESDMFNVRNVQYDDMNEELTDWDPVDGQDEEEEEEEEEGDNKQEVDRGLEFMNDNGEEATEDDDDEEEEEEDGRYAVKRSSDPDDMANLVDFYLLKVLEKTEEEEQKRQIEEEEQEMERAERRASHAPPKDGLTPGVVHQLIQISRKYQIRPEDLVDLLRSEDKASPTEPRKVNQLPRAGNKLWQSSLKKLQTSPEAQYYSRRLPPVGKTAEELRREKILQILGLGGTNQAAPVRKYRLPSRLPSRLRTQLSGRLGKPTPTHGRLLGTLRSDYDDAADEDQLTAFAAAQMMSQYPRPAYGKYKVSQKREEVEPSAAGSFEKAMEEYLDDMDSEQSLDEKRQAEDEERDEGTQGQGLENETMMKLLNYLNPETDGKETTKTDEGE